MKKIEDLFAAFTTVNETTPLVVDNNYDSNVVGGVYYDNLPEDLGKGTPREIADRVHTYDKNFYGAFRKTAGEQMLNIITNDKDGEIGSLDMQAEVSGLAFSSVWSRPIGDDITAKDCAASFGFGYGLGNIKGEKSHLKDLGARLHQAIFEKAEKEDDK